ncbi:cellulose biosynthesis cyclic di-GMP-binding regulatory protein BcsB [Paenibacillus sp. CAU 1523]|uniref:Cellulose biosynthesis cyclic di-GMP-binding regulatory protein BcsB n=2 Tax=Paenibacillus arenosi TaxID=2774142 RepID=A0ABR9AYS9_9BACL|nr:cellulose biosynthesis cyclic di-GMP-binding regulatory protein BcsB [Paenibacillus arenosi]
MMRRSLLIGITCICMLIVQLVQPMAVAAAEVSNVKVYETLMTNTNTSLSGVMTSKHFQFQTEPYWKAKNATITLDYKASQLAINDRSSVTLSMNGTKFYSFRPKVADQVKQQLAVVVPAELLVKGNNTLSVTGNIETTKNDQICVPPDRHDNWLELYKSSTIAVKYDTEAFSGTIQDFNERFTGMDTVHTDSNLIVIPEQSSSTELEAAVHALSGFAKSNKRKNDTIPMQKFDAASMDHKKWIVAVALYDHLPATIKASLGQQDFSKQALIQVVNWSGKPTLVVTSQDANLLVKAGRFIANQELMMQLNASSKVITESTDVNTPVVSVSKQVTLTETGDELKGPMRQEKSYFIALPANRAIADASKISLDMRYAKNLDFDRSMVTVYVNDKPIGSKKLTSELANSDTLTLPIPKNLDISGNFMVTVAFDLEMKHSVCIRPQDEMPWAYITKDSLLQLNTKDKTELLFNNYPSPFLRDGSFNQVAVVMPKERDSYTYLALSNMFNLLGQYAEGNTGNIRFFDDTVASSELTDYNVIAIGSYANNKVIRDQNAKLYFQYAADGGGFISNEKMSIDQDYGKRLGTLQLIESPYKEGHGLLAVTGASSEYYYLASKLLASEEQKWKVFGDSVAADKDGQVFAHRFKKQAEQNEQSLVSNIMERSDVLGFMVAVMLVIVLILVSLIFMIRKYRKKRRQNNET